MREPSLKRCRRDPRCVLDLGWCGPTTVGDSRCLGLRLAGCLYVLCADGMSVRDMRP